MIMDSLPAHKAGRVKELMEGRGYQLFCIRPATPEIQSYRGVLLGDQGDPTQSLRPDSRGALLEAQGEALSAVSLRDAWGCFAHAG
jgi:hypothetical protein